MKTQSVLCGVIGNPISHSLSPQIHTKFARQANLALRYEKYLVEEDQLESFVKNFFDGGGTGLNITLPFKQIIFNLVDELSSAAKICKSVNTLSLTGSGNLKGDTTDGVGLLLDLDRLDFTYKNKKILIVGAGGAAISLIYELLSNSAKLTLHNRSQNKVDAIISQFSEVSRVKTLNEERKLEFDGLICATSQFNQSLFEPIIPLLKKDAFVYDLNYAQRAEHSTLYFAKQGFKRISDGYGMLLGQAAKSFQIWHGILPKLD